MLKVNIDLKSFDKAMQEYMKFSKKAPSEIINNKLFFISCGATNTTQHSSKEKIKEDMGRVSTVDASAPLVGILVNLQQKKKGKKGLFGEKMKTAIASFMKKKFNSINFVRAGWKKCIKQLNSFRKYEDIKFNRGGSPKVPTGLKENPRHKGYVKPARPETKASGEICNRLDGRESTKLEGIMEEGLIKAINNEIKSMNDYVEKKYNQKTNQFNR